MKELAFWKKWTKSTRFLYVLSLGILLASIAYYGVYYFLGINALFDWEVIHEIKNVSSTIDTYKINLFDVPINSENYVVFQYFQPSMIQVNYLSATLFMCLSAFAACLGLTVVTTYKKLIWFIPGTFLFVAWLAAFKLDLLAVFGQENRYLLGTMLFVYLSEAFIFHSVFQRISFLKRFGVFLLTTVLFGVLISSGASAHSPVIYMSNFGLVVPAALTVLFMLVIGYEVLQIALTVVTYSKNTDPWVVPMNFLIVSVLYLGLVICQIMYYTGDLSWKIPFSVYLFFPVCTVLGIWSHRKRSVLYEQILPFAPGGAFLYLAMAIFSFATIGYVLSISLSPAIYLFEYLFLASQIGFGIGFFAYAFRNFYKPMVHNMPIYKMIYDARLMPHWALRGFGVVVMVFFVGQKSLTVKSLIESSYHSLKGYAYLADEEIGLAEINYLQALKYNPGGSHASHCLASIYLQNQELQKAWRVLYDMKDEAKTEYSYAALATSLRENTNQLYGLFTLQDAVSDFPNSPYINTNVGLTFYEMGVVDSALIYFNKSVGTRFDGLAQANALALAAHQKLSGFENGIQLSEDQANNLAYRANAFALANLNGSVPSLNEVPKMDQIGAVELSLLNNYINANLGNVPKEVITTLDQWLSLITYNQNSSIAKLALAKATFFNGDLPKGLGLMSSLTSLAGTYQFPYYANLEGIMNLQADQTQTGYQLISQANQALKLSTDNFAKLNTGIAALEVGDTAQASLIFIDLAYNRPAQRDQYTAIYEALAGDFKSTDLHKACYLMYHPDWAKDNYGAVLTSIASDDLRLITSLNLIKKELKLGRLQNVLDLWSIVPKEILNKDIYQQMNLLTMKTYQQSRDFESLTKSMTTLELAPLDLRWKFYFEAQLNHYTGDTAIASERYDQALSLLKGNPEVMLEYLIFQQKMGKSQAAYDACALYLQNYPPTQQMLKKYIELSVQNRLFDFANQAVLELKTYLSVKEYQEYVRTYRKEVDVLLNSQEF